MAPFPQIFSIAYELIGGKPVITYGGGGGSDSDFRRDGRRSDEEDLINQVSTYKRIIYTHQVTYYICTSPLQK